LYNTSEYNNIPIVGRLSLESTVPSRDTLAVQTRNGTVNWVFGTDFIILQRSGNVIAELNRGSSTNLDQRPVPENTIRTDSSAVKVSDPNKITKFISNISNMRKQFSNLGRTERNFLPLWMRTAQQDSIQELGFTLSIPLVYCKPGTSETIKAAINFTGFDYRQFELDIDRFLIDSTEGVGEPKYFVFANYDFNL